MRHPEESCCMSLTYCLRKSSDSQQNNIFVQRRMSSLCTSPCKPHIIICDRLLWVIYVKLIYVRRQYMLPYWTTMQVFNTQNSVIMQEYWWHTWLYNMWQGSSSSVAKNGAIRNWHKNPSNCSVECLKYLKDLFFFFAPSYAWMIVSVVCSCER